MTRSLAVAVVGLVMAANLAFSQSHQPYKGLDTRSIKALSEEQLADLRAGRGMGFALPAELNGYPGPLHVIELADALALTTEQRTKVQGLFEEMRNEAVTLGIRLIAEEAELDRLFATRSVTTASLTEATRAIGQTHAKLRATHLAYHLTTTALLTPEQLKHYAHLRGYQSGSGGGGDTRNTTIERCWRLTFVARARGRGHRRLRWQLLEILA